MRSNKTNVEIETSPIEMPDTFEPAVTQQTNFEVNCEGQPQEADLVAIDAKTLQASIKANSIIKKFASTANALNFKDDWVETKQHSMAIRNAEFWLSKKWRRCTDISCLVIYVVIYIIVMVIAFAGKTTKTEQFQSKSSLYLQPADKMRRLCGNDVHADHLAPDYSRIATTYLENQQFCEFIKGINELKLLMENGTVIKWIESFDCKTMSPDADGFMVASRNFHEKLATVDKLTNLLKYDVGLANGGLSCVIQTKTFKQPANKKTIQADGQRCELSNVNATYTYDIEFEFALVFIKEKIEQLLTNETFTQAQKSLLLKQLEDIIEQNNQLLTDEQFLNIEGIINKVQVLEISPLFLLRFVNPLPQPLYQEYMFFVTSKILFNGMVKQKCQIDYQVALTSKDLSGYDYVSLYIQYFSSTFSSPVQSALLEFDNSIINFVITFVIGICVAFAFQMIMCICGRVLIFICMIGLIIGMIVFGYMLATYGQDLLQSNTNFYEINGFYDQSLQLQTALVFIVVIVLLMLAIVLVSVSCLFASIINAMGNTIKAAAQVAKKIWVIGVYPFIVLGFCIGHIVLFAYVIFTFTASGRYDARYNIFAFTDNKRGEGISYGGGDTILLILYIVMLCHGIFLCSDILDYIIGAAAIQHYFKKDTQTKKCSYGFYVGHAFIYMIQQFGSLVLKSFLTMFMVYARPVFDVISSRYVQIPESGFMRYLVQFARRYISLCSPRTTFTISFTGRGLFRSAKEYRLFIHGDTSITSRLNNIMSLFSTFGSLFCSIANYFILMLIQQTVKEFQKVRYIWMILLSLVLGFLTSTFISNMILTILDAVCFAWSYEKVIGVSRIEKEPPELRNLRSLYGNSI